MALNKNQVTTINLDLIFCGRSGTLAGTVALSLLPLYVEEDHSAVIQPCALLCVVLH